MDEDVEFMEQVEYVILNFGEEMKLWYGWVLKLVGKKKLIFKEIVVKCGYEVDGGVYEYVLQYIYFNYCLFDEFLVICEFEQNVLLVGLSNLGMVWFLIVIVICMVEVIFFLLLYKFNFDWLVLFDLVWWMVKFMNKLVSGLECCIF